MHLKKWSIFLLVYAAGFILGILFVNLAWKAHADYTDLMVYEALDRAGSTEISGNGLFWSVLLQRGGQMAVVLLSGVTILGLPIAYMLLAWSGFLGGGYYAMLLLQFGLKGILYFAASTLPQALVYVPVAFLVFRLVTEMSLFSWKMPGRTAHGIRGYLFNCIILLMLSIFGILLESYIQPMILRWIFSLF